MTLAQLTAIAVPVVTRTEARLPPEVRAAAASVPVCYESHPNPEMLAEGLEDDLLGLFVGYEYGGEHTDFPSMPPQILLFLDNIWDLAEGDEDAFRDEVRLTYLHELGHFLGWDEDEVARRGLE